MYCVEWCKSKYADILFLQETHSSEKTIKEWCNDWGGDIICSHGDTNARGACICISKTLNYKIHDNFVDKYGRIVILDIEIKERRITMANSYAPNTDSPEFFSEAFTHIMKYDCVEWNLLHKAMCPWERLNYAPGLAYIPSVVHYACIREVTLVHRRRAEINYQRVFLVNPVVASYWFGEILI